VSSVTYVTEWRYKPNQAGMHFALQDLPNWLKLSVQGGLSENANTS